MKLTKANLAQQVKRDVNEANRRVQDFRQLPDKALRYRPQPDQWNVLDCLEHVNLFYADYFSRMETAINHANLSRGDTYVPGFFGKRMVSDLRPRQGQRRMKIKTFKRMSPATDQRAPASIFDAFFQHHTQLLHLLDQSLPLDWNRVKVPSAVGPLLRFKLGDCFRLLIAHTDRHLCQAQEALSGYTGASAEIN